MLLFRGGNVLLISTTSSLLSVKMVLPTLGVLERAGPMRLAVWIPPYVIRVLSVLILPPVNLTTLVSLASPASEVVGHLPTILDISSPARPILNV